MKLQGERYALEIARLDEGASVVGGNFYGIELISSPLFLMRIKGVDGEEISLTSQKDWAKVTLTENAVVFAENRKVAGISVTVQIQADEDGVGFSTRVDNESETLSVMYITYPTPRTRAKEYSFFAPIKSGRVWEHAEKRQSVENYGYPQHVCMPFFATYANEGGMYLGIEDSTASAKHFTIAVDGEESGVTVYFYGVGASLPKNSFSVAGIARWQAFRGDWYDAAQIYKRFVLGKASWLPEGGLGRPDTPARFQKIPFWISDYIPNSPSQRDNRPMNLSAGSDVYEPDYWYEAPVALQEELGVPIAYHVYNWHEIPFNIEYPHFLPAKEEFILHGKELQNAGILVVPYINACAWEMHDMDAETHEQTFESHGAAGIALREDGSFEVEEYPQTTKKGNTSHLAIACGAWKPWHERMASLVEEMQNTLPIDGVYFDEIANVPAHPCYSRTHGHLPGGGSYWVEGYNEMMKNIRAKKPDGHFHFTECNAEPYMRYMDGFLTWMWVDADEVPAFSAVYNGYIQLIGRCTIGNKKEDIDFFRYATAKSLVFGQTLGWCKADILYSKAHLTYLKRLVKCRYDNAEFFATATMLRPPRIQTNLGKYVAAPALWFTEPVQSDFVVGGSFSSKSGEEVRIFLVNFAKENAEITLSYSAAEYGVGEGTVTQTLQIPAEDVIVLSLSK